jgi:hypothetical protein
LIADPEAPDGSAISPEKILITDISVKIPVFSTLYKKLAKSLDLMGKKLSAQIGHIYPHELGFRNPPSKRTSH